MPQIQQTISTTVVKKKHAIKKFPSYLTSDTPIMGQITLSAYLSAFDLVGHMSMYVHVHTCS